MKRSERKANLIRRLLTNWQLKFDLMSVAFEGNNDPCSGSTSKSLSSGKMSCGCPILDKEFDVFSQFSFVHLYHY